MARCNPISENEILVSQGSNMRLINSILAIEFESAPGTGTGNRIFISAVRTDNSNSNHRSQVSETFGRCQW